MQLPQPVPSNRAQPDNQAQPDIPPDLAHLPNLIVEVVNRNGEAQPEQAQAQEREEPNGRRRGPAPVDARAGAADGDHDRVPRGSARAAPHPIQPTVRGSMQADIAFCH